MFDSAAFQYLRDRILFSIKPRLYALAAFIAVIQIIRFKLGLVIPFWADGFLLLWLLSAIPFTRLVRLSETYHALTLITFYYFILELLMLTAVIHFTGIAVWLGAIFFLYSVIYAGILMERNQAIAISIIAVLLYFILVLLEMAGFIPAYPPLGIPHEMHTPIFSLLLIPIVSAIFFIISYTIFRFAKHLLDMETGKREWEITFDSISDPLFIHDSSDRVLKCNRAYAEAAGMTFHEIIGNPYYKVFPKIKRLPDEGEVSVPAIGRTFDTKCYPAMDTYSEYLYSLHILKDITEKRKAEEALHELLTEALMTLSTLIEAKSSWTKGHSERVADYAMKIAQEMGFNGDDIEKLRIAALLHDIGKIGTYDNILDKPRELTGEEYEMIKRHPGKGADMLSLIRQLSHIISWILGHHERYDGGGYPNGLKGDEIPIQARILSVADAYDAMTSQRPYRDALSKERAIEEIKRLSGIQFDPKVVEVFLKAVP